MYFTYFKILLYSSIIFLWLYWLYTRRHYYRFAFKYPGILGLPIVGLLTRIKTIKNVLPAITKVYQECRRETVCIWMGLYPALLTVDPELTKIVLTSPDLLTKARSFYLPLERLFDGGLIGSPVEKWRHNRKVINPTFSHSVLLSFFPVFHKAKNLTLRKFADLIDKGEVKLNTILLQISLGVSVETTMGKVMKEGEKMEDGLAEKYSFMMLGVWIECLLSLLNLDFIYIFYKAYHKTKEYIRNIIQKLIDKKLADLSKTNDKNVTTDELQDKLQDIKKTPNIFIDHAIKMFQQQQLTYTDLESESNSLMVASFETAGNTVFSTLVMLATHPVVQQKLYEELLGVFPDKDFQMEYEHLEQLPYLDMVINETLRLVPAVPLIGRQVVIPNMQLTEDICLPKDMQIIISIYHIQRRTDIWGPNANKFDPDHFLPEKVNSRHPYAYLPFSKGARNCIGWRYALFAIKVMVAGLVRNFRFTTTYRYEDLRFWVKVALMYIEEPGLEIHQR